jgi:hypothetical protein
MAHGQVINPEIVKRGAMLLEEPTLWAITNGIQEYYASGADKAAVERKIKEMGRGVTVHGPLVDSDTYPARFVMRAGGITHDVDAIYRQEIDGVIYEYWVVKRDVAEWTGGVVPSASKFYITRAEDAKGQRDIIFQSDKFFESYQVDESVRITLPIDNLRIVYMLMPWLYPASYEGSKLEGAMAVPLGNNKYELRKAPVGPAESE